MHGTKLLLACHFNIWPCSTFCCTWFVWYDGINVANQAAENWNINEFACMFPRKKISSRFLCMDNYHLQIYRIYACRIHWLSYCWLFGIWTSTDIWILSIFVYFSITKKWLQIVSYFLNVLFSQVNDHTLWELLTFKFVNPMMDTGITRQLDFTDLLELPAELRATSCYDRLLSCWTAEYQNHHNDSSLLRAMFCSYGWTYLRLGLLKVSFSFYWGCSIE